MKPTVTVNILMKPATFEAIFLLRAKRYTIYEILEDT